MRLLIDLGNTRAHLALSPRPGVLEQVLHVPHDQGRDPWLPLLERAEGAWLASVVPALEAQTVAWLGARGLGCQRLTSVTAPIALDVDTPETVGADRLANAVWAARARPGQATIVVDLGTAVTFEVVDRAGAFRGGAIAPGLTTQTRALARDTALLPQITRVDAPPPALGRDTPANIAAGVFWGVVGLVEALCPRLSAIVGGSPRVVATGGDAARIAQACLAIDEVVPELTLLGLSYL